MGQGQAETLGAILALRVTVKAQYQDFAQRLSEFCPKFKPNSKR
jgi:predicted protein tyrosine phosphatase